MLHNGNKRSARRPPGMMTEQREREIAAALEKVFRSYVSKAGPQRMDERTRDFVFHMTDWHDDLAKLAALYANPGAYSRETWNEVVFGFLAHAPGHLMAAAKLIDTLMDPFGVFNKPVRRRTPAAKKTKRVRAA